MAIMITSREFNQNASKVLKMAENEPVFITKWGKVVSVVSSYLDYQRQAKPETLAEIFGKTHSAGDVEGFDEILQEIRQNSHLRITELD